LANEFSAIRPSKIIFYVRAMALFGFKADKVLQGTGLSQSKLADPYLLIETSDYIRVVSNMMLLTQWADLAFRLGDVLQQGDLGVLGTAFSASKNPAEAKDLWQEYNWLFFGNLFSINERNDGKTLHFVSVPRVNIHPLLLRFFVEEKMNVDTVLFTKFNDCLITRRYYKVSYPKPRHADRYTELLGIPVDFSADKIAYAIDFNREFSLGSFYTSNAETLGVCKSYLDRMTRIALTQTSLSAKVKYLIKERLPTIQASDALAKELGFSSRTLGRKLRSENTSYQQLVSSVRAEAAKNYFITTKLTAESVAIKLGFNDLASLSRAFKEWTGMTITQYKAEASFRSFEEI
jgi:AraC-like DNA-binding protein